MGDVQLNCPGLSPALKWLPNPREASRGFHRFCRCWRLGSHAIIRTEARTPSASRRASPGRNTPDSIGCDRFQGSKTGDNPEWPWRRKSRGPPKRLVVSHLCRHKSDTSRSTRRRFGLAALRGGGRQLNAGPSAGTTMPSQAEPQHLPTFPLPPSFAEQRLSGFWNHRRQSTGNVDYILRRGA